MKCFLNNNMSNTFTAVILTILVSYSSVEAVRETTIPEVLLRILQKYDNFNNSEGTPFNEAPTFRELRKTSGHSEIEDAVQAKVFELAPLLDDHKYSRRNEESYHDIINPAKLKYKKMRKEIEKILTIEPVTNETKRVVIEALDQIENELDVNDCYWKKGEANRRRNLQDGEPDLVIPKEIRGKSIMKHIKDKWDDIVNQYSMPNVGNTQNDTVRKIAFVFLTRLRQFVFDTHIDYTKLQDRYEMKCDDKTKPKAPVFRPSDNKTKIKIEKGDCDDIIICSEELLDFLTDFYDQLNKAYTEIFKNYIVMYLKEIDANEDEKKSFIVVLDNVKDQLYEKIKGMFKIELEKLDEVFSLPASRIPALKHLIDRTTHNVKEEVYAALSTELKKFKPILRMTVKQDINIATGIEMDNLHKEFIDKMCSTFHQCNGDIFTRRQRNKDSNVDANRIRLRFKFGLGDDPMKLLRPYLRKIIPNKSLRNKGNIRNGPKIDYSNSPINVTRTTYANDVENGSEIYDSVYINARKANPPYLPYNYNINEYKAMNVTRTTYANDVANGPTTIINNSLKNDTNVTTMESSLSYQI